MIKALLLILFPGPTWEDIARVRRNVLVVLFLYLLPLLVLSSAGEAYGLVHWGRPRGQVVMHVKTFPVGDAVLYEAAQMLLSLVVVFLSASFIRSLGDTFHTRSTYRNAFALVAYGLGPLFLVRTFDAFGSMPLWFVWAVGIGLSLMVLYTGVPRMLEPDLAHAFGLFVTSALLLVLSTAILRLLTQFYLDGKMPEVEAFISRLAAQLHL
jgi:hypothetical protein